MVPDGHRLYRLYGATVATDLELRCVPPIDDATETAELTVSLCHQEVGAEWSRAHRLYPPDSPGERKGGPAVLDLGERQLCRFPIVADFIVSTEEILVHPKPAAAAELIELCLLGFVMAWWAERRGLVVLHASAVETDESAVVFLAGRRGGKSTLAAGMVQAGCRLLADDQVLIDTAGPRPTVIPSFPSMRLHPEAARSMLGTDDFQPVCPGATKLRIPVEDSGLGRFAGSPAALRTILLPVRSETLPDNELVALGPIAQVEAVLCLLGGSALAPVHDAEGSARRIERLARVAEISRTAPLVRMQYREGFDRLEGVAAQTLSAL